MTGRRIEQAAPFYGFRLEKRAPTDHLLRRVDASLDLSFARGHLARRHGALGRPFRSSRADGPHAAGGPPVRRPLGAPLVRGGRAQPGLSLVLPPGAGRSGAGPFHLRQEPARALPRRRPDARGVRAHGRAAPRGRVGFGRACRGGRLERAGLGRPPPPRRGRGRASARGRLSSGA